jgi:ornithine decarboxylase
LLLDCEQVRRQYAALCAALPSVKVYYAIKALPHPRVLTTLRDVGCCFDIASSGEIDLLREQGVPAERTIHTHPIKSVSEIRAAIAYGCNTFVVDNVTEIEKLRAFSQRAELLLRVSFRSPDAVVDLSKKFGCSEPDVLPLLKLAHSVGLRVKGLSFHVGSQCSSPRAHVAAIEACAELMMAAARAGLPPLQLLDIGGGFPVPYRPEVIGIEPFCRPIRDALAKLPASVQLISEPGRFLAAPAMHAVSSVVGKARRGECIWYYLDDGAYGSYSGQIYDGARYPLSVLTENAGPDLLSLLAGPTCDSIDMVSEQIWLPELSLSDLVVGHMMGAYTSASASEFNSFPKAKVVVLGAAAPGVVSDLKRTAS